MAGALQIREGENQAIAVFYARHPVQELARFGLSPDPCLERRTSVMRYRIRSR